ncbi:hypothetical protein DET61_12150 [Marinobacter nauticus]|jgi:hypothetical protein|uniref:Uncharacterized protein n=1 Tax=Marinobacter nauticus TaxID=2743 RepID=A0A368V0R2_MARNT|nr:hypothetical protein DET64_10560 [Marinobacter nauticus]RCW34688.1 hypothetical protein DET51_10560 [Marinobacter nauticus]RCW62815.1 hypothetical protein DET61_12150 [Marinobacter nauticus]
MSALSYLTPVAWRDFLGILADYCGNYAIAQ